ncbi:glycosyltransferase [Asticcacaulis endophyticus]|uniref:Glycosyl transferase n=1 Tax=Asticcacaulis endophyticus TaxID=1395890 RepID=A0A918Q1B3_9CAUL|nr:glycosyltransferase [Asticcacaulis endophyticus]GGZ27285.1 glycosyl transferase [Asticcacaulis endophyticus]
MRILNLMLAKGRGGLETMAVRYHQALLAAGHEAMSLGHPQGELARLTAPFAPIVSHFSHDPLAALAVRRHVSQFQPDLILCHGNRAIATAVHPLSGGAGKTVAIVHNFRFKRDIARARAALTVSRAVRDALHKAHPLLKIFDMPNFAPLEARPVKPAPKGVPVIGALGRLHVNKGFDILLEAVAELVRGGREVRVRIAGDGPEKVALEAQTTALGLNDRVEFCGWVDSPADYLSGLDLFVLSSRVEPFGLVVTEAMAAGVPVVSFDIDGPREILQPTGSAPLGGLCAAQDAGDLAQAINAAIDDWPATLARAEAARMAALETYGQDAGAARLSQILSSL